MSLPNMRTVVSAKQQPTHLNSPQALLKHAEGLLEQNSVIASDRAEAAVRIANTYIKLGEITDAKRVLCDAKHAIGSNTTNLNSSQIITTRAFYTLPALMTIARAELKLGWQDDALETNTIATAILKNTLRANPSNSFRNIMQGNIELLADTQGEFRLFDDAKATLMLLTDEPHEESGSTINAKESSDPTLVEEFMDLLNAALRAGPPVTPLKHDFTIVVKWQARSGDLSSAQATVQEMDEFKQPDALKEIAMAQALRDDVPNALATANEMEDEDRSQAIVDIIKICAKHDDFTNVDRLLKEITNKHDMSEATAEVVSAAAKNGTPEQALFYLHAIEDDSIKGECEPTIAHAYIQQGRLAEAESFINDSMTDDHAIAEARFTLMDAHGRNGNVEKVDALADAQEASFPRDTPPAIIAKEKTTVERIKANAVAGRLETAKALTTGLKEPLSRAHAQLEIVRTLVDVGKLDLAEKVRLEMNEDPAQYNQATLAIAKGRINSGAIATGIVLVAPLPNCLGKSEVLCKAAIALTSTDHQN